MTTHPRSNAPDGHRCRAAGPAANLFELPDPADVSLTVPGEVDAYLGEIEAARQRQLDAMPPGDRDPVALAYRATVDRILQEVRAARQRVLAGRYGICTGCDGEVPAQWLEQLPWAATCARCSRR